jgi:hypothetical protein
MGNAGISIAPTTFLFGARPFGVEGIRPGFRPFFAVALALETLVGGFGFFILGIGLNIPYLVQLKRLANELVKTVAVLKILQNKVLIGFQTVLSLFLNFLLKKS